MENRNNDKYIRKHPVASPIHPLLTSTIIPLQESIDAESVPFAMAEYSDKSNAATRRAAPSIQLSVRSEGTDMLGRKHPLPLQRHQVLHCCAENKIREKNKNLSRIRIFREYWHRKGVTVWGYKYLIVININCAIKAAFWRDLVVESTIGYH